MLNFVVFVEPLSVFQCLHQKGVGCDVKHAAVFTENEENALWEAGVLGEDSPKALLRSSFVLFFFTMVRICASEVARNIGI